MVYDFARVGQGAEAGHHVDGLVCDHRLEMFSHGFWTETSLLCQRFEWDRGIVDERVHDSPIGRSELVLGLRLSSGLS